MPIQPRRLAALLILSSLSFWPVSGAQANGGFMQFQIPPWAGTMDSGDGDDGQMADAQGPDPQKTRNSSKKHAPRSTPMTPQDYVPLIEQMAPTIANAAPQSPLEDMYSRRVVDDVKQFGYDFFGTPGDTGDKSQMPALPAGAVQDNFVLNIGDKLNVTFRGQRQNSGIYSISSEGLLIIEDMTPVAAAGRTIAQVRDMLETMASDLHNTDVFVSLDSVRQVNILVVGHVQQPGRKNLTVFHTALDALMQSGGVQKTGSLRQIKLIREGRTQMIDLYSLLVYGSAGMDLSLRDGDKIVVPPIGPTLAVTGGVKRPGIYEILPSLKGMRHRPDQASERLSLQEALDLGGGLLSPGNNRFMELTMTLDGREVTEELSAPFTPALGDGSILVVARANEKRTETVELAGHTRKPGIHALKKNMSLSSLLSDEKVFGPDIYPLIGVIERTNPKTMTRQIIDFPPQLVLAGDYDRKLEDGDSVILFSRAQVKAMQSGAGIDKTEAGSIESLDDGDDAITPALRSFLMERAAFVRGAVREAGGWPVSEGATLDAVLDVAGGLSLEANVSNIEVTTNQSGDDTQGDGRNGTQRITVDTRETPLETVAVAPGDAVRVNQKFRKTDGQSVMIVGEVFHPGKYDLLPGDTLGKLLARAGGVTDQAYPDGTIFSRDSDRRAEEARFRAAARELERAVAAATEKKDNPPDAEQIAMARDLADELRTVEGVGRITVEADPGMLETHPELDILLEPGDKIYMPRRPLTVRVHGEVLSPANLQFRSEKSPNDYIDEAGGMTYYADDDRTFVLHPDGSAQPLLVSAWNHKATFIPPGSTIVVPRDPKPFDFMTSAKDFSQILSNLAITGIFLSDIKDDDD